MSEDMIQVIWDKGRPQKNDLSVQEIEQALRPDVRRQSFAIRKYIWIWLVALAGTFILDALNILGYSGNPIMLTIQVGLTLLGVVFGIYGFHLLREIHIMDRADESVTALLQRRLRFYRTKFEIWNFMIAGILLLLTFAINSYIDNQNGSYSIGRAELFITFSLIQFGLMYVIIKIAQYPIRKEMKIFLSDLEGSVMEGTKTLVVLRKRWRKWAIIAFIIGTILLLLGIWRAMQFGT